MTTGEFLLVGTVLTALGLFASAIWTARKREANESLTSLSAAFEQLAARLEQTEAEIDRLKARLAMAEGDASLWRDRAEEYEKHNTLLLTRVAELTTEVEQLRQIVEQHDGGQEASG